MLFSMAKISKKIKRIVGIGEVVFDIMPDSRKLGGAPADFLRFATTSGIQGELISAIGADDLGREVVTELNKYEIKPVLAITPYPTGRVLIFNNPAKGHTAHILENAAWDYIPFTTEAELCIQNADAIYFDTLALRKSYSCQTILDLIDAAPQECYRFFDINLRQNYYDKNLVQQLLSRANILKLNIQELRTIAKMFNLSGSVDDMCLALKTKYGLRYIILTTLAKESRIWGLEGLTIMQNKQLQQSFAYGAGNAFAGAFMSSILKGLSQKEAHQAANDVAAEVCKLTKGSD